MHFIRRRWPWLLLGQALSVSILTALSVLLLSAEADAGVLYSVMMWGVVPLGGALAAFIAVRMGLNAFAAFWLPPVFQTAVHWGISGFPPLSAGMPLATALAAIVGAATGEEWMKREKRKKQRKK